MKARGVTGLGFEKSSGFDASIIFRWRSGDGMPRLETAARLAEALDWPRLLNIVKESRYKKCENPECGQMFYDESAYGKARYHEDKCAKAVMAWRKRGRRGANIAMLLSTVERELRGAREAVGNFCHGCEPDGICHTPDCALRGFSPLPLSKRWTIKAS